MAEAVALLDEAGEGALTFRALAQRLGGGVGSIYWYVDGKDQLLDRACDPVMGEVLVATEALGGSADPLVDLRAIAVELFDAIERRPWLAAYFLRDTGVQPHGLRLYDRLGHVVGIGADLGRQPPQEVVEGRVGRDEFTERYADSWRELDPAEYPYLHHVVDEFAHHDDRDQFLAGLDLLLAGLRIQAHGSS